ncbi:MAG: rhomboid family intramembrane serine protease [Flavobacteriaceae bacterium]|jgi:membrane associated rhomboid family serine protease|nr:rhomboid family intramembrane serine protease [Flavobacteriaceae bacterium]
MVGTAPFILVLLAAIALISYRAIKDPLLFNRLKFNVSAVENGEYYRLLTAGFIHVDYNHLFFNGFTLFIFGGNVLYGLGTLNFILLYLISLLMGNGLAYYYHKKNPYYTAVGASGAIMGIVYSSILMFPEMELAFIFFPVPMPAYVFGVGYLIYTLFGIKSQNDGIGHTAHFGGAIGGIICTLVFDPFVFEKSFYTLVLMVVITLIAGYFLFRQSNR